MAEYKDEILSKLADALATEIPYTSSAYHALTQASPAELSALRSWTRNAERIRFEHARELTAEQMGERNGGRDA